MTNEDKYKIVNMLERHITPREISNVLDISLATVIRFKTEYDEAKLNNKIDELIQLDKIQLEQVLNKAPIQTTQAVVEGVTGLARLDEELQLSAGLINDRVRNMVANAQNAGELSVLTNIICSLREAFFNKNVTQVNIQNNIGQQDESKYKRFLSDVPAKRT